MLEIKIRTFNPFNRTGLLCAVGILSIMVPAGASNPLAARWEGSVQIPGNELTLIIDLSPNNDGAWTGSVIIPELNTKGVPLKDIVVKDSDATFAFKSGPGPGLEAAFKAHLDGDGRLTGEFVQGGNTAPFELKQAGPAQVEAPPRSTSVTKEIEGEWQGEYQLFGYARKVTLKLTNNAEHGATAEFVVVGKRVNNLPVDLVTQEGNLLTVHSHETGITFEGRFRKESAEMSGTISQGPIETPLVLRRK